MKVDASQFAVDVHAIVAAIPAGKVLTYGMVARLAGAPQHSRLVGRVLRGTADGLKLPCHRVVNSVGRTTPGWADQRSLLEAEGVAFKKNGNADLATCLWRVMEME